MDRFAVNSSALNSGGVTASIVYLPSSVVTIDTLLFERSVGFINGDTGMAYSLLGSITSVSFFGNTAVTGGFEVVGDLTKYARIYIEAANTTFGFDGTGTLQTVMLGTPGDSSIGTDLTGDITRTLLLSGSIYTDTSMEEHLSSIRKLGDSAISFSMEPTGSLLFTGGLFGSTTVNQSLVGTLSVGRVKDFTNQSITSALVLTGILNSTTNMVGSTISNLVLTGNLTRGVISYIPPSNLPISLVLAGHPTLLVRFSGNVLSTWILEGDLSIKRYLSGSVYTNMELLADLANNASGQDLAALLMIRPAINREMIR